MDLSAFGVNVEVDDTDYNLVEVRKTDQAIKKYTNPYWCLQEALESLDDRLSDIMTQLCLLAQRYDDKLESLVSAEKHLQQFDSYQL